MARSEPVAVRGPRSSRPRPSRSAQDHVELGRAEEPDGDGRRAAIPPEEIEVRRRGAKRLEDPRARQPAVAEQVDDHRTARAADVIDDRIVQRDELAGADEEALPFRRQRHSPSRPHEQGGSEAPLELRMSRLTAC